MFILTAESISMVSRVNSAIKICKVIINSIVHKFYG